MKRYVTVEVTADDIRWAKPGKFYECPIALAAHRAGYLAAAVGSEDWYPDDNLPVPLSERAAQFVDDYDNGRPVTPGRFRLALPAVVAK